MIVSRIFGSSRLHQTLGADQEPVNHQHTPTHHHHHHHKPRGSVGSHGLIRRHTRTRLPYHTDPQSDISHDTSNYFQPKQLWYACHQHRPPPPASPPTNSQPAPRTSSHLHPPPTNFQRTASPNFVDFGSQRPTTNDRRPTNCGGVVLIDFDRVVVEHVVVAVLCCVGAVGEWSCVLACSLASEPTCLLVALRSRRS